MTDAGDMIPRDAAHLAGPVEVLDHVDGLLRATWSEDGTGLVVIRHQTGETRPLTGHGAAIDALAVASDGRHAASASQNELLLWDLETERYRRLHGHTAGILDVAFSPDGRQLASAGADGTVRLWSAELALPLAESPDELARAIAAATTTRLGEGDQLVVTESRPSGRRGGLAGGPSARRRGRTA